MANPTFTDAQVVDIRRHSGYPVFGNDAGVLSYRYFQVYGFFEFRIAQLTANEAAVVINTYLANLTTLENAIPAASANLDTDAASVWIHNKREVADRAALFTYWRKELCNFLGVPPGPFMGGPSNSMSLVV